MRSQRRSRRAIRKKLALTQFEESESENDDIEETPVFEELEEKKTKRNGQKKKKKPTSDVATEEIVEVIPIENESEVETESPIDSGKDWWHEAPGKDNLRILIATDNHLGFRVNDPIRGNDSFKTMEEIFQLTEETKADIMLLSGDLFHCNKPTRKTMHETLKIFRKYVFGKPRQKHKIKILSDAKENFSRDLDQKYNAENPNLNIKLPVFGIHGNHDDPTRDGTDRALSAMDMLQMAGVINYFGVQAEVEKVDINPILITKGKSKLSLYGLGWMRDERLFNLFSHGKVNFNKPSNDEEELKSWYHLMLVHQNRQNRGRGNKNCLQESFLPSFLDLVVFGHEHECRAAFEESISEPINLCQPGSSVATTLVAGEEIKKHVVLLEITTNDDNASAFRYKTLPLKTVRPFVMKEVCLERYKELAKAKKSYGEMEEGKKQELLVKFLDGQVKELIAEAKSMYENENPNKNKKEIASVLPLIRLRVDYTGFPLVNLQRFGARFTTTTANPSELISYFKRRQAKEKVKSKKTDDKNNVETSILDEVEDIETAAEKISALVNEILDDPTKKLQLLDDKEMSLALDSFVTKQQSKAIEEFVKISMSDVQDWLKKGNCDNNDVYNENDILQMIHELKEKIKISNPKPSRPLSNLPKKKKTVEPQKMDFEGLDDESDEDFLEIPETVTTKKKPKPKRKAPSRAKKKGKASEDEEIDLVNCESDEEENKSSKRKPKTTGRSRRKNVTYVKASSSESDTDLDTQKSSPVKRNGKRKAAEPPTRRSSRRKRTK